MDSTIKVWNTKPIKSSGKFHTSPINSINSQQQQILSLAVSGSRLYSGSDDSTIKIWNIPFDKTSLEPIDVLVGHNASVNALVISSPRLYSASSDKTIKIWDITEYPDNYVNTSPIATLNDHECAISVLLVNKNQLFSGSIDGIIKVWNLLSSQSTDVKSIAMVNAHSNSVDAISFYEYKVKTKQRSAASSTSNNEHSVSPAEKVNKSKFTSLQAENAGRSNRLQLSLDGNEVLKPSDKSNDCKRYLFSCGSFDHVIKMWEIKTKVDGSVQLILTTTFVGHSEYITCLVTHDDMLFSGSIDNTIKIWDLSSYKINKPLITSISTGNYSGVNTIIVSPAHVLIAGFRDSLIKIWQLIPISDTDDVFCCFQ